MEINEEFLDAYNEELGRIGCPARIGTVRENWHAGSMLLLDQAGNSIGLLPDSVEATELAAIVKIVESAFERGMAEGRRLANS